MASSDSPSEASGFQDLDISIREQVQNAVARYAEVALPPHWISCVSSQTGHILYTLARLSPGGRVW